jgi:hypothetical protein
MQTGLDLLMLPLPQGNVKMYLMAGVLVIGFVCNVLIGAVNARHHLRARRRP